MPHCNRENMRPARGERASIRGHTVNCPTAGAKTRNEVIVLNALLGNAVWNEMVMAEGELEGDECN